MILISLILLSVKLCNTTRNINTYTTQSFVKVTAISTPSQVLLINTNFDQKLIHSNKDQMLSIISSIIIITLSQIDLEKELRFIIIIRIKNYKLVI